MPRSMTSAVGWEIVDPAYYGRYGYPHASWAWLRRHAPVAWIEAPGMRPFWAITRYEDCGAILRDHRRFVIAPRIAVFPEEQAPADAPPFRHLLNMDPPEHGRYRNLLSQHFTPKALERKRAAVGAIVDETLARAAGRSEVDGAPIPEWELMSYYVLLIVAGNETTRNATSGGLLALMENRGELEKLRRDPALIPTAVEEIVRWVSPVIQFCRTALEDLEVRATRIRKGDACCIFYPSANRDDAVFPDPFAFRVDRAPNEHYGFGIG